MKFLPILNEFSDIKRNYLSTKLSTTDGGEMERRRHQAEMAQVCMEATSGVWEGVLPSPFRYDAMNTRSKAFMTSRTFCTTQHGNV